MSKLMAVGSLPSLSNVLALSIVGLTPHTEHESPFMFTTRFAHVHTRLHAELAD